MKRRWGWAIERALPQLRIHAAMRRSDFEKDKNDKFSEIFATASEDLLAILDKPQVSGRDYEQVVEYLHRFVERYPRTSDHHWSYVIGLLDVWLASEGYGSVDAYIDRSNLELEKLPEA